MNPDFLPKIHMSMFRLLTTFLSGCGIVISTACLSQGQAEIPLGAMPMQYNPSFAGQMGGPRISSSTGYDLRRFNFVNDHASRTKTYSIYTSYDQFIPLIRSGIALTAGVEGEKNIFNSVDGNNKNVRHDITNRSKFVSLAVAPKLSIRGKYTLSPSVDIAYSSLQSNTAFSSADSSSRYTEFENLEFQSRAGILFNTHKYYIGYSVILFQHIRNPYTNMYLNLGRNFQSFLQMGYTFQKSSESKFSFTPQLLLRVSKFNGSAPLRINFEDIILNFRYKQFIWGFNNRGIHVGWQTEKIRLMLTNGLGGGKNNFYYTGNLSFRYIFSSKDQRPGRSW